MLLYIFIFVRDLKIHSSTTLSYLLNALFVNFVSEYMAEKLGVPPSKIDSLCTLLYKHYGTTMAGLRVN